ncbi:MAG: ribosome biogenesis GTPase YlqF [Lachnospiraceae bacterium]|nr:ribosome biogenesis GTPase YlqF [Lachnospiraceae bacterium]
MSNNIQWYPGHMTKAVRQMQEDIKLIDLVVELVDARLPLSSKNPDIDNLAKNKSRIIILNKADLADDAVTAEWEAYFKDKGFFVVKMDSRKNSGMKDVNNIIQEACKEKIERDRKRGIKNRPVRTMVVGIPNVGKSTFINSYAKKAATKTGNKPGVTKGKQWIKLSKTLELLDTPGILWPKFEDERIGIRLAIAGSINDQILNLEDLAGEAIDYLTANYKGAIEGVYTVPETGASHEILSAIAEKRNCLKKGGELDTEKAAKMFLDDFRSGRLGKITLEKPEV